MQQKRGKVMACACYPQDTGLFKYTLFSVEYQRYVHGVCSADHRGGFKVEYLNSDAIVPQAGNGHGARGSR